MEKDEGIDIAAYYEVTSYPTLLYINPEGKCIERIGFAKARTGMISIGEQVGKK